MKKIPHLVQYQGSKRNLAKQIVEFFPDHFGRLIEPFSGTAAMSIYCACQEKCESFLINDLNKSVASMLNKCISDPDGLSEEYQAIWEAQFEPGENSKDYYNKKRKEFNENPTKPGLTLFILARIAKGAIRYNSKGEMNQICDKRRNGTNPKLIKQNADAISKLLKGKAIVSSLDYKEVLEQARPGDIVYMDPPYQGVAKGLSSRYISSVDFDEFVSQLQTLNDRGIDFVVSYDGKTGGKSFGKELPDSLECQHILIEAGRSSQATLNGKAEITYESLYISRGLRRE